MTNDTSADSSETQPVRPATDSPAAGPTANPTVVTPTTVTPTAAGAASSEDAVAGDPRRRRFRDRFSAAGGRLRGVRGLVAATLAALIIGGLGGAAIHAAVDDHHDRDGFGRGEHPRGPHHGDRGGPGRLPRAVPPSTDPEDGETLPTPVPDESSAS